MNSSIFISTPAYGSMVTVQYMTSILNLQQELSKNNINFCIDFISNESLIPRARNKALSNFMKTNFTHFLFIDADIQFEPSALIENLKFNKDVVCCPYAKKGLNWNRFIYSMQNDKNSHESPLSRCLDYTYNAFIDQNTNKIIKKDNFIKVKHASTGFMLIKKDILTKMHEKYKDTLKIKTDDCSFHDEYLCGLFCCEIKNEQYLSEDYAFCERVYETNGEVWVNVKQNLNHIGIFSFESDIKNRKNLVRSENERIFYS